MAINSKSTKAEILEAYDELKQEKAELEKQLKQKNTVPTLPKPEMQTPPKPENKIPSQPTIFPANMNLILQNLEKLQVSFGSATSNLSEQLITEASALEKLRELLAKEIQELQELHDLETIEEDTLDNLIQAYEESDKAFAEEYNQQKETLEQEIQELKKAWHKEQENHRREIKERDEIYFKTTQREAEEYGYNLKLQRDLDKEEYEQRKQNLYQELITARQEQEKQWKEREDSISEREKQYAEATFKVEAFEKELEGKIKQGKEEGRGIGNYQAKVKADLHSKEVEGEKQNYQLRIQSLEEIIQHNEARINALSKQLDGALKQVQDLAVKAIEGTSNRNSFDAMKEIALEQAKNQQKGK
ncbi:MAG: hypothetical protein DSM107014_13810 [Gomphosphaeria aponina SAG 52.96 = DSM 107014]|uniref:Myosin heavy chain n=1 Tax=Gomphosphaeria aponina SAG 52.96 = DSM 107014 TaxID=1521640 RepID=A0A941GYT7_9CHRO|nr:hypothetical protein [Gomphosphaeria aponina SAG 52.96 = DSM 107014]